MALTAVDGFVGRHVIEELRRIPNISVRGLTRRTSAGLGDALHGDLTEPETCARLVDGADVVIHAAGLVRSHDRAALHRANVTGTEVLIEAARKAATPRFVHVSTTGVYGLPGGVVSEASARAPATPYEESKLRAESIAMGAFRAGLVVVQPSNVIGPGHALRPLRRLMTTVALGRPIVHGAAWTNYVSVADVARVIVAAAISPDAPRVLIVNQPLPLEHFLAAVGRAVHRPALSVSVPALGWLRGPLKTLGRRSGRLDRAVALVDDTRFVTEHGAWFAEQRVDLDIASALRAMAVEYGLGVQE